MRIKIALLDHDLEYLERRQSFLTDIYGNQIEVLAFTSPQAALASIERDRVRVLIIGEQVEINTDTVPPSCAYAFLVESSKIVEYEGAKAIGRHIPVDDFFREITLLFESVSRAVQFRAAGSDDSITRVVTFTSPAGGSGTTSAAIAFARALTVSGKRPLYLNLDPFQKIEDLFAHQHGNSGNFHDLIFAVKERRNLDTQFTARTMQDQYGVHFFASAPLAADVIELNSEDLIYLLEQIIHSDAFDLAVIDLPFALRSAEISVFSASDRVVLVSSGRPIANEKISRALETIAVLDQRHDSHISPKTNLLYNRFSSKQASRIADLTVPEIGGINRFENATELQVIDAIVSTGRLDRLVGEFN